MFDKATRPSVRLRPWSERSVAKAAKSSVPTCATATACRPSPVSTEATLTPLPPARSCTSSTRCDSPSVTVGTAYVMSMAGFGVRVTIIGRRGRARSSPRPASRLGRRGLPLRRRRRSATQPSGQRGAQQVEQCVAGVHEAAADEHELGAGGRDDRGDHHGEGLDRLLPDPARDVLARLGASGDLLGVADVPVASDQRRPMAPALGELRGSRAGRIRTAAHRARR